MNRTAPLAIPPCGLSRAKARRLAILPIRASLRALLSLPVHAGPPWTCERETSLSANSGRAFIQFPLAAYADDGSAPSAMDPPRVPTFGAAISTVAARAAGLRPMRRAA
jgi:hypothetical protein